MEDRQMTTTVTNAQTDHRLREAPNGGDRPDDTRQEDIPMTQAMQEPRIRNGINVDTLYGTLDAIKAQPGLATFQFRATNTWMGGAHNRSTIKEFYGAGQKTSRAHRRGSSTRASRRSCSASTRARTRPSTCCTRWQRA